MKGLETEIIVIKSFFRFKLWKVLASRCYDVILNGFGQPEEILSNFDDCRRLGAKVTDHHCADLSDPSQIEAIFKCVVDKFGCGPDVRMNNAGQ